MAQMFCQYGLNVEVPFGPEHGEVALIYATARAALVRRLAQAKGLAVRDNRDEEIQEVIVTAPNAEMKVFADYLWEWQIGGLVIWPDHDAEKELLRPLVDRFYLTNMPATEAGTSC